MQVVVGSFVAEGPKEAHQMESLSAPQKFATHGVGIPPGATSPSSHGTLSESSGSPLNQSTGGGGACNNNNPHGMPWK